MVQLSNLHLNRMLRCKFMKKKKTVVEKIKKDAKFIRLKAFFFKDFF